jgi:hypothetical protein
MIHQISQVLILIKVTGMNLSGVSDPDGVNFHDSVSVDDNTTVLGIPTEWHCYCYVCPCGNR